MVRFSLTGLLWLALCAAECAHAQTPGPAPGPHFDAHVEKIANQFQIERGSADFDRLMNSMQAEDGGIDIDTEEKPIIRHIRGSAGKPFQEPALPKVKPKKIKKEDMRKIAERIADYQKQMMEPYKNPKPLPRCTTSDSERIRIDAFKGPQSKLVLADILFIHDSDMPKDTKTVLGENVDVREIKRSRRQDMNLMAARTFGATCLPLRVRITGKYTIRETGMHAVRNYDKNPNGKGALHKDAPEF